MITAVFYLLRQKKSAEFLQAMEEDRWEDSFNDPPRSMTAKRYEALQHIAALIQLFSIYQTEPIYRALFKWDAQSALMGGEKKMENKSCCSSYTSSIASFWDNSSGFCLIFYKFL